jgi:hypothetical protein
MSITLVPREGEDTSYQVQVGDELICTQYVHFIDDTEHNVGDRITVTEDTRAYYNLSLGQGYELVKPLLKEK